MNSSKPPTFTECSICGREFGSRSILIHEPQCLQKLRATQISHEDLDQAKPKNRKKKKKQNGNSTTEGSTNIFLSNSAGAGSNLFSADSLETSKFNLPKIQTSSLSRFPSDSRLT